MQITLGVLCITLPVRQILAICWKYGYFLKPHECSHALCAHNLIRECFWYCFLAFLHHVFLEFSYSFQNNGFFHSGIFHIWSVLIYVTCPRVIFSFRINGLFHFGIFRFWGALIFHFTNFSCYSRPICHRYVLPCQLGKSLLINENTAIS